MGVTFPPPNLNCSWTSFPTGLPIQPPQTPQPPTTVVNTVEEPHTTEVNQTTFTQQLSELFACLSTWLLAALKALRVYCCAAPIQPFEGKPSLHEIKIKGDGACLFRALAWGNELINNGTQEDENHSTLRTAILGYMSDHKSKYAEDIKLQVREYVEYIQKDKPCDIKLAYKNKLTGIQDSLEEYLNGEHCVEDYLTAMQENPCMFGSIPEIQAAAEWLKVKIEVLTPFQSYKAPDTSIVGVHRLAGNPESFKLHAVYGDTSDPKQPSIQLCFHNQHYSLLAPIS